MDRIKGFLNSMVAKGKITQEEAENKLTRYEAKVAAKEKYSANKSKLTKAELQTMLDTLLH